MENHIKYSKGVCWISDCRIPFVDEGENKLVFDRSGKGGYRKELVGCEIKEQYNWEKQQGRFTPNLLVCDDLLNDGVISKSNGSNNYNWDLSNNNNPTKITKNIKSNIHFNDKGTNSRYYDLDTWFDKIIEGL